MAGYDLMTTFKTRKLLFLLLVLISNAAGAQSPEKSVVKIFVTRQQYDYDQPWQRSSPVKSSGSGSIIDSNRILTCAHVIEFGEFIEVRKAKDARKYTARVKFIAPEYDLAILEVDDPRFFSKSTPMELSELPHIGERVTAYGFPTGGDDLSITSGIVSRIENIDYSYSDYNNLGVQIDAAINPGNSGGPVLQDGKQAGVAFQGRSQAQSIGYMIPTPVIRTFLRDIADGVYDGPVPLYLKWQKLENPALRLCYGVDDTLTGVLINEVHAQSALNKLLLPNDVLLAIDSIPVQNDGTILLNDNLKTSFETALQIHNAGDEITFYILRNGEPVIVKTPLHYSRAKVRLVDKIELQPKYYIENGFVFTTPSYYYFKGDAYWAYRNPQLSYYYYDKTLSNAELDEIVLLSSVLPDQSNVGYHDVNNRIIRKVNGQPVRNFAAFIEVFKDNKDSDIVLEDTDGSKYVIPTANLPQINQDIMKRYGIRDKMRL